MRPHKRSRGAALVVAMLVAALVAVIAAKVGSHYIFSFRRSAHMLLGDQSYLFLLSAEALAKNVLIADEDKQVDHLGEVWAQQVEPYVIDGGLLTGQIYDLQARFNLNNLHSESAPASPPGKSTDTQYVFMRLLRSFEDIEVSEQQAQDITVALIDWLDNNAEPAGFGGAEDGYYTELDIPYRTANRSMLSASELRLVKGMTAELYQALVPHITALPLPTPININTAGEHVLRSLAADPAAGESVPLSPQAVQAVIEMRQEQMTLKPEDFYAAVGTGNDAKTRISIAEASDFYLFEGLVKLGDLTVPIRSVLNRNSGGGTPGSVQSQVSVIRRSLGSL